MPRSNPYHLLHITTHPVMYLLILEPLLLPAGGGGMLPGGQVVWTKELFSGDEPPRTALAYVDGLGMILLDPRWLKHAPSAYSKPPLN